MKLKNRKTGEIIETYSIFENGQDKIVIRKKDEDFEVYPYEYKSLAELTDEWEDYEEPKEYWYIDWVPEMGTYYTRDVDSDIDKRHKEIGNYFETKEEAEKAVKKLKALKRLKEAGFEFGGWTHTPITKSLTGYNLHIKAYSDKLADYMDDLQLLFGGEE